MADWAEYEKSVPGWHHGGAYKYDFSNMKQADVVTTSLNIIRWLEYRSDVSEDDEEGKEVKEEVKKGICILFPLSFMTSYILLLSEKGEPKGKEAASRVQKQGSSKGKEASNAPAKKRRGKKTDDASGTCFILIIYISADGYYQQSSKRRELLWHLPKGKRPLMPQQRSAGVKGRMTPPVRALY